MTNYPPTPAFGGFPLPAPKGPPGLSQGLRKLSINSVGSNNTTLPSSAIQSPNYLPKFPNNSSASRQQLFSPPSAIAIASPNPMRAPLSGFDKQDHKTNDGAPEDREEGELSDAEDLHESHINKRNNHSGSKQRDRGIQNQQGREFAPHGMRTSGEAPNHPPIARSQTWNEPYRRESTSQGWNQQGSNRKRSFDLPFTGPPKVSRGEQHEKKFDPPSQPKGNFRDHRSSGPNNIASPPSGPKNGSPSFHCTTATKGIPGNNSPVHISTSQFPLEALKTVAELRSEAQSAVLNMLPLKVTFKYMVEEAGIDANVLKKVFTGIGLPVPTETPSPSPSGDIDHPHRGVAKLKPREKSSDRMELDKEAQSIRRQLEKDARDRERREAEAKAAELVRQREAAKEEEEKKRRLAEVEAKKEVLRRKIDEMKLPGKSASPSTPLTPISSTPVMEAIAKASAVPPPKPEVPRIPGLLLGQLDGCYSDTPSSPGIITEQYDIIMKDSPEPAASQSSGRSAVASAVSSNISTGPATIPSPERPFASRRKRPVASDMYSEPMPITKRKFGDQRKVPIELIIDISDEEEEEEEEEEEHDSEHTGNDSGTSRSTPSGTDPKKSPANGNNSPPHLRLSNTAPTGSFTANGAQSKLDSAKALQDKEEQIRALKEAIQKAQQMKKMRAKAGMSTPTPVGTPTIGMGPSIPPPLTEPQQVTDVAVLVSSTPDKAIKEDEITRQKEEKQKLLLAQASQAKANVKLKELRKKEKEEKMKVLLTEIEEIEKSEAEKRKKKAEEVEAAEKRRQQAKEEMERKLKEAEDERQKNKLALMKIRQEFERMQREESEMEARKEALKAELAAMEKAVEQTADSMGEKGDEVASQAISKKKEEIEQLKKAMEESEVDQTNFEAVISSVSSAIGSNTRPFPGSQPAEPDILEDSKSDRASVQDDAIMMNSGDPRVNGLVGTYQQSQASVLGRAKIAASQVPAVYLPISADSLEDAMELDQQVNEGEKVNDNDVYTDVDMDAQSDDGGGQEDKVMSTETDNEVGETSEEEKEKEDSEEEQESEQAPKLQALDTRHSPASVTMVPLEPILPTVPKFIERNLTMEEANLPTSVPEQELIEELADPAKITSTTALTSDTKKQKQEKPPRQPEHVFAPYKSPLTNFKSFRYHPNFLDFCPGGYKSLTFSNRIDPMKPLCRWELSGGTCSDTSCLGQHQRQLEIPDEDILVELASVVEGSNEEERNNYNRGLRQAIAAMREQGIKDFQTVVAGIASYRRRFLGDETRVLRLPYPPTPPVQPSQQQQRTLSSFSSYT